MTDLPLWKSDLREHGDSHVVALTGELDLIAADEISRILVQRFDQTVSGPVVADLSEVTFLDSAALGALIIAFQHARDVGRGFLVTGAIHGVRRIMEIAGVYDLLSATAPSAGE